MPMSMVNIYWSSKVNQSVLSLTAIASRLTDHFQVEQ